MPKSLSYANSATTTVRFVCTGTEQVWTVPDGVTQMTFELFGAQGGAGGGGHAPGGLGGHVLATMEVVPRRTFEIRVACAGPDGVGTDGVAGGYPNGGSGGGAAASGGGGGGDSDITYPNAGNPARFVVAGGGGGAGACVDASHSAGGAGGGDTGEPGQTGSVVGDGGAPATRDTLIPEAAGAEAPAASAGVGEAMTGMKRVAAASAGAARPAGAT